MRAHASPPFCTPGIPLHAYALPPIRPPTPHPPPPTPRRGYQELFDDLSFSKYQKTEYRISIYGRNSSEWDALAAWVVDHQLYSPHNR